MPGTQPNIIIIRDGAKPYGGMITFDLQWFPPPPAWENNSLEKLIDVFPKAALLLLPCFKQISSAQWKMFWFLLHLESGDKSPTHLSLNFAGCIAVERGIYHMQHGKVHLHPPHCSHSHHYPHRPSLLQLSPLLKTRADTPTAGKHL